MGKWGMEFMALSNKNWEFDTGDCLASNRSRIFSHIHARLALVFLIDTIAITSASFPARSFRTGVEYPPRLRNTGCGGRMKSVEGGCWDVASAGRFLAGFAEPRFIKDRKNKKGVHRH